MSTYATAVLIDSDDLDAMTRVLRSVIETAGPGADANTVWAPLLRLGPTTLRGAIYQPHAQLDDAAESVLAALRGGRVAVADDFDEYGAAFASWRVDSHTPRLVYRALICPEDDESLREDSELPELTGEAAARRLAALWAADVERVLAADPARPALPEELQSVAGPFPWWSALGLAWPSG